MMYLKEKTQILKQMPSLVDEPEDWGTDQRGKDLGCDGSDWIREIICILEFCWSNHNYLSA